MYSDKGKISLKDRILLKIYCYLKLPLIAYCRPRILVLNHCESTVKIPLSRRTKNHFNSMYFGALSVGADFTAGLLVMNLLKKNKSQAKLLFKDFKANFIKRGDSDIFFTCKDYKIAEQSILENIKTNQRINFKLSVIASSKTGDHIADFILTTSIK